MRRLSAAISNPGPFDPPWSKLAEPNLSNKEGLPALPFRAGEVPVRDSLIMNIPEAKDYQLVYDLDISNHPTANSD